MGVHVTQEKYKRLGLCPKCGGLRTDGLAYCPPCREIKKRDILKHRRKIIRQALEVYSESPFPSCSCCGESIIQFLTLDHIEGKQSRTESGVNFYATLRRRGWPMREALRVLCYNCNCGRQANGGSCPHEGLKVPKTDEEKRGRRIKTQTFKAYGGKCFCCGERNLGFLTLDHVNGRVNDLTGIACYFDLQTRGWPDVGVEVACFN